jgi:ribosome-associated protein
VALEVAEVAKRAVDAALNKQAVDILLLDVRGVCSFTDYFVICSGDSERQIQAICNEIDEMLSKGGIPPHSCEGSADSGWVLLDFGGLIVHIFSPQMRTYYELERLWSKATPLLRIL